MPTGKLTSAPRQSAVKASRPLGAPWRRCDSTTISPLPLKPLRSSATAFGIALSTIALAAAALLLTACGPSATPTPFSTDRVGTDATVERVVDGDTIVAKAKGHTAKVRFIGVDTPETVAPNRPVGCYGQQASDFTKSLLPAGTPIHLVYDVEREDKYGRTLAYVFRQSDRMFVNEELVRQGYAQQLTIPPNIAYASQFTQLVTRSSRR